MTTPPPLPHARHALVACAVAALAYGCHASGLDDVIARATFDAARGTFPAGGPGALQLFGHRYAKIALWIVWLALLGASAASHCITALAPYRRVLWATTVAFAIGPLLVSSLKLVTGARCPWDLIEFGGRWPPAEALFVRPAEAGRCFPAGHASGGYALLALYFAGAAIGAARLRSTGLWLGLLVGSAFGAIRMIQGAHFLSHTVWSAALVWAAAALVFAIAYPPRRARPTVPQVRSA